MILNPFVLLCLALWLPRVVKVQCIIEVGGKAGVGIVGRPRKLFKTLDELGGFCCLSFSKIIKPFLWWCFTLKPNDGKVTPH